MSTASASASASALTSFSIKPLDEQTLKVARDELGEDPKRAKADCELLRDWLKQHPHIKSIDTDEFLLRFLRVSKFSILKCQERIENFWTHRSELPQWFRNVDITNPLMQEIHDLCYSIPLPEETDDHCRVLLVRTGCWSTTKYELDDIMKYSFLVSDILNKDPRVQINGWIGLIDFEGATAAHAQQMTRDFVKNAVKCWQETYPGRIKGIHFINYPKVFDVAFSLIKMFLKDKTKKRLVFHGNDLRSLQKHIPKKLLPKQYGGTNGDLFELNEIWREELLQHDSYLKELEKCGIDATKIAQYKKQTNSHEATKSTETIGVYRKINTD